MKNDKQQDDKLSKLIQLKRFEKPSNTTWLQFEFALERKRLALNTYGGGRNFLETIFNKKYFVFVGNLALVAIIMFFSESNYNAPEQTAAIYAKSSLNDPCIVGQTPSLQSNVFNIARQVDGVNYVCDTLYAFNSPININAISY